MTKLNFTTKTAIALYAMLAVVFLSGCDAPTQYVQLPKNKPYLIIGQAELSNSETLGKYRYTTRDNTGKVVFYLDEKFNIGDTVCVGKNYR
jgi:hypothetical protein